MQPMSMHPEDPDDDVLAKLRRERDQINAEIASHATRIVSKGVRQHVGGEQLAKINDRYTREYAWAAKAQRHLWVATCAYVLTEHAVANMTEEPVNLDVENLLSSPAVGCFICEEPYSQRIRHRKCPGDPSPPS